MSTTTTKQGKVKWFDPAKNWGFITQEDGKDIFVHISGVIGGQPLQEGQRVEFEIANSPKGPKAASVRVRA